MLVFNWPETPSASLEYDSQSEPSSSQNVERLDHFPAKDDLATDEIQQRVAAGDNYLDVGSYLEALKCYRSVQSFYRDDPAFLLRLALAIELSGYINKAEKAYVEILRTVSDNESLRRFAILGLARCRFSSGQLESAIELLCGNLLTSDNTTRDASFLESEFCLQIIKIKQRAVKGLISQKASVLDRPIFEDFATDGPALIGFLKSTAPLYAAISATSNEDGLGESQSPNTSGEALDTSENNEHGNSGLSLIQNPNDDVKLMVVSGATGTVFIKELLNRLETLTNLEIPITNQVAPFLTGRTANVDKSSLSVALLLDCILTPCDLAWRQDEGKIVLFAISSLSSKELLNYLVDQTIRAGRYYVLNFPDSERKNSVRVTISNLKFSTNQFEDALSQLIQLEEESAHVDLAAKIEFDLGLLETKFNRLESAIEFFMAAIDQSESNYIRSIAYANVGRIQLQRGAIEPAKIASSRSLMLFNDVEVQQQAALDLARAYLLSNNPLSANQTLYQHASVFTGSRVEAISLVYGAYARTLGTLSPLDKKKALKTLIIALAGIRIEGIELHVDRILIARAFVRAGLVDRAISVLDAGDVQSTVEGWNRDRIYELAMLLEQNGEIDKATEYFSILASANVGKVSQNALLRAATLALYENDSPNECLEYCSQLWSQDLQDDEKSIALKLMGEAYAKDDKHELATFCFLGMLPNAHDLTKTPLSPTKSQ